MVITATSPTVLYLKYFLFASDVSALIDCCTPLRLWESKGRTHAARRTYRHLARCSTGLTYRHISGIRKIISWRRRLFLVQRRSLTSNSRLGAGVNRSPLPFAITNQFCTRLLPIRGCSTSLLSVLDLSLAPDGTRRESDVKRRKARLSRDIMKISSRRAIYKCIPS